MNKSNSPLVSIIVPCYNVEHYIDRCMSTLIEQTLKDIEIILIDDGSPDKVPFLCDEYAKQDSRIKVIHKQNEGLGFARNSGLEAAKGEYVAFVDSDDYVDVTMFESLYREARITNADAVFCGFKVEEKNGSWTEKSEVEDRTEFRTRDEIDGFMLDMIATAPHQKLERRFWMSVWHSIYKREIITNHNIKFLSEREVVSEDIPFQCIFLQKASKVVYLPDCFYYYCLNNTSLTKTFNKLKFLRFKNLHQALVSRTQPIPQALQRIDRLYIGYVRSQIVQMIEMGTDNSKDIVGDVINDEIWNELQKRYKPSYLPIYPRLFYYLILYKQIYLIIVLSKLVCFIKSVK